MVITRMFHKDNYMHIYVCHRKVNNTKIHVIKNKKGT